MMIRFAKITTQQKERVNKKSQDLSLLHPGNTN